eukprot:snap_masked-scaffold_20-processed-gene-5.57-mRNA-1 protein AED:1.00 eAED:1.00 QI:0/0/0/0/1/1/2/0/561
MELGRSHSKQKEPFARLVTFPASKATSENISSLLTPNLTYHEQIVTGLPSYLVDRKPLITIVDSNKKKELTSIQKRIEPKTKIFEPKITALSTLNSELIDRFYHWKSFDISPKPFIDTEASLELSSSLIILLFVPFINQFSIQEAVSDQSSGVFHFYQLLAKNLHSNQTLSLSKFYRHRLSFNSLGLNSILKSLLLSVKSDNDSSILTWKSLKQKYFYSRIITDADPTNSFLTLQQGKMTDPIAQCICSWRRRVITCVCGLKTSSLDIKSSIRITIDLSKVFTFRKKVKSRSKSFKLPQNKTLLKNYIQNILTTPSHSTNVPKCCIKCSPETELQHEQETSYPSLSNILFLSIEFPSHPSTTWSSFFNGNFFSSSSISFLNLNGQKYRLISLQTDNFESLVKGSNGVWYKVTDKVEVISADNILNYVPKYLVFEKVIPEKQGTGLSSFAASFEKTQKEEKEGKEKSFAGLFSSFSKGKEKVIVDLKNVAKSQSLWKKKVHDKEQEIRAQKPWKEEDWDDILDRGRMKKVKEKVEKRKGNGFQKATEVKFKRKRSNKSFMRS